MPEIPDAFVDVITERYIELYEKIIGKPFVKADNSNIQERIEKNVLNYLNSRK
jgi:phosphoribosylaminoimidazole-succinocarboxamide synthase